MVKPPKLQPLAETFRLRPFPHWDPVPDWVLSQLDSRAVRQIAAVQLRFQKTMLEQQALASAEIERIVGQG